MEFSIKYDNIKYDNIKYDNIKYDNLYNLIWKVVIFLEWKRLS